MRNSAESLSLPLNSLLVTLCTFSVPGPSLSLFVIFIDSRVYSKFTDIASSANDSGDRAEENMVGRLRLFSQRKIFETIVEGEGVMMPKVNKNLHNLSNGNIMLMQRLCNIMTLN